MTDKGNEKEVIQYLYNNKSTIQLNHLNLIQKLEIPYSNNLIDITNSYNSLNFASDDSSKKADLFINGKGISIKQSGGSVLYNKWQRKNVLSLMNKIFNNSSLANQVLSKLDKKVVAMNKSSCFCDAIICKIGLSKYLPTKMITDKARTDLKIII